MNKAELEKIKEKALADHIPIIMDDTLEVIKERLTRNPPKRILEIGTAIGYSAIRMALLDKEIHITTIERDFKMYEKAKENISKFHLENQITLLFQDALEVLLSEQYDLIFIDAAKAQYIRFFEKFQHNLSFNGVIVSDNLQFHGLLFEREETLSRNVRGLVRKLKKYITFLKENKEFQTEFYSIGDGISISKRS